MRAYIFRRLLLIIPTLWLVTIIVFVSLRFIPGSVIDMMVAQMTSETGISEETIQNLKHALGLDAPIHVQYLRWLKGAVQGDLGKSLWRNESVVNEVFHRLPISIELAIMAIIVALLIAIPIGTYSAIRQDTAGDYIGRTISILFVSLPSFWIATIIFVYPSIYWNWSPPVKYTAFVDNPGANLFQFIIPAVIMGMYLSGISMRMTRTMMLEVLRQDYIRTAWSKGLKERTVVLRHALKNALIPIVTIIGIQLPNVIGGGAIIEQIFGLPGVGRLMVDALNQRDYPVVSGINVIIASLILVVNLVVDMTYSYLDPRVKYK